MTTPAPSQSTRNVLLIGGGGREHALAQAIKRSPRLGRLFSTHTTNPGLASLAEPVPVPVSKRELYRLEQFCDKAAIDFVIIGPEDPLAEGFADRLNKAGDGSPRLVFGPVAAAARLEADKAYAKQLMKAASIPTADARTFTDPEAAIAFLESRDEPMVVKATGLAKGKGVIVPKSIPEAVAAVKHIMVAKAFGDAGRTILIEEMLEGKEVSVLALVDGRTVLVLPTCRDHKRLGDRDTGPNTGGMGAFCPAADVDDDTMREIERDVLVAIVDALRRDGVEFRGVLYAGIMLTPAGPKVLEFNTRFGDPECQPLMARLTSDPLDLFIRAANGTLEDAAVTWDPRPAVTLVLAAHNYPEKPRQGDVITGLAEAAAVEGVTIQHAGTARNATGDIVTAGGRVLNVTALGDSLAQAKDRAYKAAAKIHFAGKQQRRDIAANA